jgi:putative transcriptional regulator
MKGGDRMKMKYKIDVLACLRDRGLTVYRLRKDHIFGGATIESFRSGEVANGKTVDRLCELLNCKPSDIIDFKEE